MICKKCGKELGENDVFCKFCGASVNETKKPFVLHIDDEKLMKSSDKSDKAPLLHTPQVVESISDKAQSVEADAQAEQMQTEPEQTEQPVESETSEKETKAVKNTAGEAFLAPVKKPEISNSTKEAKNRPKIVKAVSQQKDSKQAIKSDRAIKIIVCVCAIIMATLAIISINTDIFKNTGADKTVALSKLSDEQIVSFEQFAAKLSPLYEIGYDSSKTVLDDVIYLMNPTDENGLYASFYGVQTPAGETPDPAKRFVLSDGTVSYGEAQSDEISTLAESLGLESHDDINTVSCYYYGGKYYFENVADEQKESGSIVKVTSSKRTSNGDFYVICDLYDETAQTDQNGNYTSEARSQLYFIVIADGTGEDTTWTLENLSDEPLFTDVGEKITRESTGESLSYEIVQEKFSAKMSDGRVYENYVVEYPSFENNGTTAITINSIYDEIISELKEQADVSVADGNYEEFISGGGSDYELPLYTHVIASVQYDDDGYISIIERRTLHTGKENADEQTSETTTASYYQTTETTLVQTESVEVYFPQTTYEGYTFEIETGEFVKRDDLIGKDYVTIQGNLFNAWLTGGGKLFEKDEAVYGQLQSTTQQYGSVQVYSDTNGIGKAIYDSSWIMTADGIEFLFKHEDNALDIVTIPRNELEKPEATDITTNMSESTSEDMLI